MRRPLVTTNNNEDASFLLDECNTGLWKSKKEDIKEDASILIDMKCPLKLQELQMINGDSEYSIKEFSIFGSNSRKGPWSKLQSDKLKQGKTGLQNLDIAAFKTLRVREKQDIEKEIEKETEVGFVFDINNM